MHTQNEYKQIVFLTEMESNNAKGTLDYADTRAVTHAVISNERVWQSCNGHYSNFEGDKAHLLVDSTYKIIKAQILYLRALVPKKDLSNKYRIWTYMYAPCKRQVSDVSH